MSFAKLFSSITESSLWSEPKEARLLFVSMLARADATGFIEAAVPGLQRLANLTEQEVAAAIEVLSSPDPHSKNPANEGRRIMKVPGGWMILNFEDYRNRRGDEERREYMREYMREYRKQSVNNGKPLLNAVKRGKTPLAQAEAEAEAEVQRVACSASAVASRALSLVQDSDVYEFKSDATLSGVDIEAELAAMRRWCNANGKHPTKKRFVNWLNRTAAQSRLRNEKGKRTNNHSVFNLTKIIEAKRLRCDELKNAHAVETGLGSEWSDYNARKEYTELRGEIKALNQKLRRMA